MNGVGGADGGVYAAVHAVAGEPIRLRMCNTGENFALRLAIDSHDLTVISTDGLDTEPLTVDALILHLGERYDAVITPPPTAGGTRFWIRAHTLENDPHAQVRFNHGVLGVLGVLVVHVSAADADAARTAEPTIDGAAQPSLLPTSEEAVWATAKTLKCIDIDIDPENCLPVTALTAHADWRSHFNELLEEPEESHEIVIMGSGGM